MSDTMTTDSKLADRIGFYVINLDRSTDRMERFRQEFENFPIPFTRFSAVNGSTLELPHPSCAAWWYWVCNGRNVMRGEIGCYLSHVEVLKQFLASDKEFALICEDDAAPMPELADVLSEVIAPANVKTWDVVRLIGGRSKSSFPYRELSPPYKLCTSITGMVPSAAHLINRKAAEILARRLVPMIAISDAALWTGWFGVREATVMPNPIWRHELGDVSTVGYGKQKLRELYPYHMLWWTCRLYRLYARACRYTLQTWRIAWRAMSR